MFRLPVRLALLLALPAVLAAPAEPSPAPLPPALHKAERMELRFQHREARIREALERGDLTPHEAERLRERLEKRRERLEMWRQHPHLLHRDGRRPRPVPDAAPPSLPASD